MAVLARPEARSLGSGPTIAETRLDVGNSAIVVLTMRGADGVLNLQGTLDSPSDLGWQDLPYATTLGGPTTTGPLSYTNGSRVYIAGPWSFLQITGTVISGTLTLWSFASPFIGGGGVGGSGTTVVENDFTTLEEQIGGLLEALESPQVRLLVGLDPVDVLNPLPVGGAVDQGSPGTDEWPVVAGSRTLTVAPSLIVSTTPAYSAGDVVGNLMMVRLLRTGHNGGVLESLTVTDLSAQSSQLDIFFFSEPISLATDNTAFAPSAADMSPPIFLGVVSVAAADYVAAGAGKSTATKIGLGKAFGMPTLHGLLCVAVVTRGTPTYGTPNSLRLIFDFLQD